MLKKRCSALVFGFLPLIGLLINNCDRNNIAGTEMTPSDGEVQLTVNAAKVSTLGKAKVISLCSLSVTLTAPNEDPVNKVVSLVGNKDNAVQLSFGKLKTNKLWTAEGKTIDINNKVIHTGTTSFTIQPGEKKNVSLSLDVLYSMLVADFNPIRDSVTHLELLVDNSKKTDSTFGAQSLVGKHVKLSYDYLSLNAHTVELDAYGTYEGDYELLYSGDTTISVVGGKDTSYVVTLNWVSKKAPRDGQLTMSVVLGKIGTVLVNGQFSGSDTVAGDQGGSTPPLVGIPSNIIHVSQAAQFGSGVQISGDQAVWAGLDGQIYLYDGSSTFKVTNSTYKSTKPDISGGKSIWITDMSYYGGYWHGSYELNYYDGNSITKLIQNVSVQPEACISGDYISWISYDNVSGYYQVYLYNNGTTQAITNSSSYYKNGLDMDGNRLAWMEGNDVWEYNGNHLSKLNATGTTNSGVKISGNNAVWQCQNGSKYEVWLNDGNSSKMVDNSDLPVNPVVCGNNVAYTKYWMGKNDVYLYNGTNSTRITQDTTTEKSLRVSDAGVTWVANDGTADQIYYYSLAAGTITKITNDASSVNDYQLSGNRLGWCTMVGEVHIAHP